MSATIALQVSAGAMIGMLSGVAIADPVFPNRPIRLITPYAPGGSTTLMARLVGQHFTSRWGQNVIVDKMSAEIGALLAMPDVKEKLEAMGLTTMISTPDQFGAMIKSEIGLYAKVIRAANIRIE